MDLSADFRLRDAAAYPRWYGHDHVAPELLAEFVYGLPELFRAPLAGARLVAAPGCYPTAAALALAPLVRAGAIEDSGVIVDAASGVSGAGRKLSHTTHFNTADEDFTAYGLLNHRHTPEIEQASGAQVLFTPHLAPMNRGILATCYARPATELDTDDVLGILRDAYVGEPFVVVSDRSPSTKATLGSNCRARDGACRSPHRLGGVAVRHRQPREGRVGPSRAVRQHRPRPARDHRALRHRGVPMSVTAPKGFAASGIACGIKASGAPDLALVASTGGVVPAAGVFTANLAAAAPVQVSRAHLAATAGHAAAVVLSSGNANAATGAAGVAAAQRMCALVGEGLGVVADEVLVCQTGLIGIPFPLAPVESGIPVLVESRLGDRDGARAGGDGDHDDRHRAQGGRPSRARGSRWGPWPRGRPCWPRTWRPCSPCSRPTPGAIPTCWPRRSGRAVDGQFQPDERRRVHVDQRHRAGAGERGERHVGRCRRARPRPWARPAVIWPR